MRSSSCARLCAGFGWTKRDSHAPVSENAVNVCTVQTHTQHTHATHEHVKLPNDFLDAFLWILCFCCWRKKTRLLRAAYLFDDVVDGRVHRSEYHRSNRKSGGRLISPHTMSVWLCECVVESINRNQSISMAFKRIHYHLSYEHLLLPRCVPSTWSYWPMICVDGSTYNNIPFRCEPIYISARWCLNDRCRWRLMSQKSNATPVKEKCELCLPSFLLLLSNLDICAVQRC